MIPKAVSLPLAAMALLFGLCAAPAPSGAITPAQCADDYDVLIVEIERNRQSAIAEINRQLADAETQQQRDSLNAMLEQAWDDEERQRVTAGMIRRDCEKAAKING